MRKLRIGLALLAGASLLLLASSAPEAFHSGGVAECGGCHSMHSPAAGGTFLLVGTDASSACLTCHEHQGDTGPSSYHVSTAAADMPAGIAPLQRAPGGDFGWIKKDYSFTVRGTTTNEDGDTHGHNVIAADFGYAVDGTNATSPGGTFSSSQLACNSCHDPHGKYRRLSTGAIANTGAPILASGSYATNSTPGYTDPPAAGLALGVYRLLAGDNYEKADFPGVPPAKAPSTYNRTEAATQTRVAYGHSSTANGSTAWGEWCATCHGDMHSSGNYVHPVDETLGSVVAGLYNSYKMTGDLTGVAASSFTSLVPFIENNADYGTTLASHAVNNNTYLNGPASGDRVSCLSCHRAHASGWEYALRWNMEGEFMTVNSLYPGTDTTPAVPQFARGRLAAETAAAYYDRPVTTFASYQRVLCNKCHAQD